MRKALIPAFLLVVGSLVLGATVFREPLANAAALAQSVFISNGTSDPVPVVEQNRDAAGNIRVHESGTANVNVTNSDASGNVKVHEQGTVPVVVQDVAPAEPYQIAITCTWGGTGCAGSADVPAGKRFVIQTISAEAAANVGITVTDFSVGVAVTNGGYVNFHMFGRLVGSDQYDSFSEADARSVTLYADAGNEIAVGAQANGYPTTGSAAIDLSGYLVPLS